jgi:hypothetical protein
VALYIRGAKIANVIAQHTKAAAAANGDQGSIYFSLQLFK